MTTASAISSLHLSPDICDREANANAAMLYLHAVLADAADTSEQPGRQDPLLRTGRA
jgi:hypothetical protein